MGNDQCAMGNGQWARVNKQHSTFNIQNPTSNIQHPKFKIQNPTSNIKHQTANKTPPMNHTNSPEMTKFIKENATLFWYTRDDKKENLSPEVVVEFVLNFGTESMCKQLFELLGVKNVADIFYRQTAPARRVNYFPRTRHFFDIYFHKNA